MCVSLDRLLERGGQDGANKVGPLPKWDYGDGEQNSHCDNYTGKVYFEFDHKKLDKSAAFVKWCSSVRMLHKHVVAIVVLNSQLVTDNVSLCQEKIPCTFKNIFVCMYVLLYVTAFFSDATTPTTIFFLFF